MLLILQLGISIHTVNISGVIKKLGSLLIILSFLYNMSDPHISQSLVMPNCNDTNDFFHLKQELKIYNFTRVPTRFGVGCTCIINVNCPINSLI